MRFLGVGDHCDLGSLYLRLKREGHEVRMEIANPLCHGTLEGMVPRIADWRAELGWIKEAGEDGIILFENVAKSRGALQDDLRSAGLQVVGGSAFGDRLEKERGFAQDILRDAGMKTSRLWEFAGPSAALAFLDAHPARYVLKYNGESSIENYVGRLGDGRDIRAFLNAKLR